MVCSIGTPYSDLRDYAEENFSTKNQSIENSSWFGQGADALGLSNQVTSLSYENAYRGIDDQVNVLRRQLSNKNSRPGRDLTFSAPKSVSLLALVPENRQIIDAHRQAVNQALKYTEQNCIFTRIGQGGHTHQQTQNIVVAIFQHQNSRNLDPNLHSHCVLFNQTQGDDGKWRAMDNRQLYQQNITIGKVYHHQLGQQLMRLGYEINWDQNGTFEVAGFKLEQLQHFSSRRVEIINVAGADSSTKEKAKACISTRTNKQYVQSDQRKALLDSWEQKYNLLNLPAPETFNRRNEESKSKQKALTLRRELIDKSIQTLLIRDITGFKPHQLLQEALTQAQGLHELDLIQSEIEQHPNLITNDSGKLTTIDHYQSKSIKTFENSQKLSLTTKRLNLVPLTSCDRDYKISQVIQDCLSKNALQQSKTIILTDTERDKYEITSQMRRELIQMNKLGGTPIKTIFLQPKNIAPNNLTNPQNYQVGNVIKFARQSNRFSNQRLYKILSINENNKTVLLGDRFGNKVNLPLNRYQNREIFVVRQRELRIGEAMQFNRGQYVNGKQVSAGQAFIVTDIKDNKTIVIAFKGKQSNIKTNDLFFTEYNYAATLKQYQQYQHKQVNSCVYCPSAAESNQLSQQQVQNLLSQTKGNVTVYTNADNLTQQHTTNLQQPEIKVSLEEQRPNTYQTLDDTLFEFASSANYLVLNEGIDVSDSTSAVQRVYNSLDGMTIKIGSENLSIHYDDKLIEFDRDFKLITNEFLDKDISQLNQQTQKMKQQSLGDNRHKQIQRDVGLSL
jgi:conjugative relaxase-like TrwC/TraI family protein